MTELTPGVTDNTPSASQVTISGAFAYDNVFLMNGVDINDNVLGTPNNLFIEDADSGSAGAARPESRPSTAASAAVSSTSSRGAAATRCRARSA